MTQKQRNREEVVNTQLAILISRLGVTADAETIHVHGKHRPDVLFELRGLRVVIEGKFADHPNAEQIVLEDARKRVRSGIAHIAAATVYPLALRHTPTTILGITPPKGSNCTERDFAVCSTMSSFVSASCACRSASIKDVGSPSNQSSVS